MTGAPGANGVSGFGVSSEYGTLRKVVVGSADEVALPPFSKDLSHYNEELRGALERNGGKALDLKSAFPERWERTREQIEGVVATYERFGVEVLRLRPYSDAEKRHLGDLQPGHAQLYPADPVFVIGQHILEICIRRAYRRKEIFPIRDALLPIIEADPEIRYVAMPQAQPHDPAGAGPGPFLEGGDILLLGEDIFVGESHLSSNRAGIDWLARYIEPYGYRVHRMPMQGDLLHALGVMCLLREGLLMAYLPAFVEGLPEPLRDWEVIELTQAEAEAHATVGVSLDERHYMIDPHHNRVMDELGKRGVEPVPVPSDALAFWGGAIRCVTLPLARD